MADSTAVLKIGKLADVKDFVSYKSTARWQKENAAYQRIPAFIGCNVVCIAPIALVTYLVARRAFAIHHVGVRWAAGCATICGGLVAIAFAVFIVMLGFYNVPESKMPGGAWVGEYNRKMALQVAGTLLGHFPVDAWQIQVDRSVQLLANKEILLLTDYAHYIVVAAPAVKEVRKLPHKEVQAFKGTVNQYNLLSYDPNGEIVSLILNDPPQHEWGPVLVGPFEITLNNPRPHGIWINRDGNVPDGDRINNDEFMLRLMRALHPERR